MSRQPLVNIKNLSIAYLDKVIIEKLSLSVSRGEVVALVGANGCGKSTLLDVIAHTYADDSRFLSRFELRVTGELHLATSIALGYLPQHIESTGDSPTDREDIGRFQRLATAFGLNKDVAGAADSSDGEEQKRAIIKTLTSGGNLLLLDEPTNYLDIAGITAFEEQVYLLRRRGCGILLVSHDRTLINNLADRTVYLTPNGNYQTEGGFAAAWSLVKSDLASKSKQARVIRNKISHLQQEMRTRMNWATQKEKSKKGAGADKPHIARMASKMAARAQTAQRKADREIERLKKSKPFVPKKLALHLRDYPVRHREVFSLRDISFDYGRSTPLLLSNLDLVATTRDRLSLMGGNGAGKSTLFRIILGQLQPQQGERRINEGVRLRSLPQGLAGFFTKPTLLANFTDTGCDETVVRWQLGGALLRGDKVHQPVENFSRGELVRAAIVKCLLQQAEFLLLDEPTSHLDIESVEVLEQLLDRFPGGYLIISHDRSFVENVSDRLYTLDEGRLRLV